MKALSFFIISLMAALSLSAAPATAEPSDTVANIPNPSRVVITDNGSTMKVEVTGTKQNPAYNFAYAVDSDTTFTGPSIVLPFVKSHTGRPASRSITFFSDVYIGFLIPYHAPEAVRLSGECGIGNLIGYRYNLRNSGASFGYSLGISAKWLNVHRGTQADIDGDRLTLSAAPEGASDVATRLVAWNAQIPIYYTQRIHRSLAFKIAAIMNFNFHTSASSSYKIGNVEYKKEFKGLHQRVLTPEFAFSIGSVDFGGVYLKWSPVTMFKRAYGPQIATYSIGLTLGL